MKKNFKIAQLALSLWLTALSSTLSQSGTIEIHSPNCKVDSRTIENRVRREHENARKRGIADNQWIHYLILGKKYFNKGYVECLLEELKELMDTSYSIEGQHYNGQLGKEEEHWQFVVKPKILYN